MTRAQTIIRLLLIAVLALPATPVWSQDDSGDPSTTLDDAPVTDYKTLSTAERREFADTRIERMREATQRAVNLLETTRSQERDVLKLNCINEKLSAMKGFLKIAEKAEVDLTDAINRKDEEDQLHQLRMIDLSDSRVQTLAEETETCTGEVSTVTGDPKVQVDKDPDMRQDNPVDVDTTDVPITPLEDVSPYQ